MEVIEAEVHHPVLQGTPGAEGAEPADPIRNRAALFNLEVLGSVEESERCFRQLATVLYHAHSHTLGVDARALRLFAFSP